MNRKLIVTVLAMLFLAACATSDRDADDESTVQEPASRYSIAPGVVPVGAIPAAIVPDAARGRTLEVAIDYPTRAEGPSPVIIFSHAFGSSRNDYIGLVAHWASNGYVVIRPTHADAQRPGVVNGPTWESQTPAAWRDRVRDITLILDSFDRIEQDYPELKGKIDRNRVGVGGHGYGAFISLLLAGAKTYPNAVSYADPRVKGVIAMAPGRTMARLGLNAQSFAEVRLPLLLIAGDAPPAVAPATTATAGEPAPPAPAVVESSDWSREAFGSLPAGDKWLITIAGAGPGAFTGRARPISDTELRGSDSTWDPNSGRAGTTMQGQPMRRQPLGVYRDRELTGVVRWTSLAFWDAYLTNKPEGRTALENASGRVELERR